jgi:hypothetical protein
MIEARGNLVGEISTRLNLEGELSGGIVRVYPDTQDKTVTPTKEGQTITPDEGVFALSSVTVNPIPDEYITPAGTLDIKENGEHDVRNYEKVDVSVSGGYGVSVEKNTLIFGDGITLNGSEVIL